MSATQLPPLPRVGCRVLMLGTAVMAAAAAAVLAAGTQDTRLLRLGLVAALWAALLGAFAAAQMRREARSHADHADHMRTTYQFELEREVTARREHTLRVERELREQAERSQRQEIVGLRAELAAMRANLEMLTGSPLVERVMLHAEATRVYPLPAQPHNGLDYAVAATIPATHDRPAAPASVPSWELPAPGAPAAPLPASSPYTRQPGAGEQRTVEDLLAAHGALPIPRRRRNRTDAGGHTSPQ